MQPDWAGKGEKPERAAVRLDKGQKERWGHTHLIRTQRQLINKQRRDRKQPVARVLKYKRMFEGNA